MDGKVSIYAKFLCCSCCRHLSLDVPPCSGGFFSAAHLPDQQDKYVPNICKRIVLFWKNSFQTRKFLANLNEYLKCSMFKQAHTYTCIYIFIHKCLYRGHNTITKAKDFSVPYGITQLLPNIWEQKIWEESYLIVAHNYFLITANFTTQNLLPNTTVSWD